MTYPTFLAVIGWRQSGGNCRRRRRKLEVEEEEEEEEVEEEEEDEEEGQSFHVVINEVQSSEVQYSTV